MKDKLITLYRVLRPIFHFLIILGIFALTYHLRQAGDFIPGLQLEIPLINLDEFVIYALVSAVAFIGIGFLKKFYELHKPVDNYITTLSKVWIYWFITITFVSYFGAGFLFEYGFSRFVILGAAFLAYPIIFFFDQIWNYLDFVIQRKSGKKILIVSSDVISSHDAIVKIKNNFNFPTEFATPEDLEHIHIGEYSIVVAMGMFEKGVLQDIFEKVRFYDTRFFHISEGYFLEDVVYKSEKIGNIMAMEYTHSKLDGWMMLMKRLFDLVTSFFGIIVLSPFLLLTALVIKLDSKGPILYKNRRVGKGGKEFDVYKFRSMYYNMSTGVGNAEDQKKALELEKKLIAKSNQREGALYKIGNDPRITKVGVFIRKYSIDELPQLFNVLVGNMSLIGPRPHQPREVENYENWQKRLLSIKPGITGYAQVFGRSSLSFNEEAKFDLYYIQNWSLLLDFYVLFATFGVVFKGT